MRPLAWAALAASTEAVRGGFSAIGSIEKSLLDFIRHIYDLIGWPGVVLMMAIESAAIPLPSEVIMPLAGWFLIKNKGLSPWWLLIAALLGALGNTLGSLVTYWVGAAGGRPLLERYGRYLLVTPQDLERADGWFRRYGLWAVLIGRLMPVIRTFISIPAGIAHMELAPFTALTFAGSFVWSLLLVWAGYLLGQHYDRIRQLMRPFDYPIAAAVVLLILWYVYHHIRRSFSQSSGHGAS